MPSWLRWDPTVWPPQADNQSTTDKVPTSDWQTVVAKRIPLDSDDDTLQAYCKTAAYAVNHHRHTHTCKKGGRGGGHHDCRMNFDLPLVPETCRLADSSIAVKREDGMLVPCVPALVMAYPSNHLMQPTCEGSRFLRSSMLWQDAMNDPTNETRRSDMVSDGRQFLQTTISYV